MSFSSKQNLRDKVCGVRNIEIPEISGTLGNLLFSQYTNKKKTRELCLQIFSPLALSGVKIILGVNKIDAEKCLR